MKPKFVHLNIHTEYSISDGLVRIEPLIQKCIQSEMPSLAITDKNNFFGLVKFYKAALQSGIKPIIGVDLLVNNELTPKEPFKLVLLAQNEIGYKNLLSLVSTSYLKRHSINEPSVAKNWILDSADGIIALSGGLKGDIGQALLKNNDKVAQEHLVFWQNAFKDRFYIELERTNRPHEEIYIQSALNLAEKHGLPVVATNDVRFLNPDEFEAHEARVSIHDGTMLNDTKRPRLYSEMQYLKTPDEMITLFQDIPEAISNTIEIAKRCNVKIPIGKNFLPVFPLPKNSTSIDDYFTNKAQSGLNKYLEIFAKENYLPHKKNPPEIYQKRLDHEIKVIKEMGFSSYFLIVADFIAWAKQNNIPVSPGRGSGAGSLVAYSLNITDIDPLEHELLFERFLNPERVSLPDFDIDFCMDGRDRVIEYVINRYGRERVAQIVTHGTMAAKAVVRDVGRVLGYPYGFVDRIAKLIPFAIGITLNDALKQEEILARLYQDDPEVKTLIDLALKIEGIVRNVGKHAAGVVIAPTLLTDFTALYAEGDKKDEIVTHFDKDDVEAIGLVKFDFLGLRTLTIIAAALKNINHGREIKGEKPLDITHLALDDKATFQLLKSCATTAVFQLESRGMKEVIKRLQPDSFDDLVALVALYRPGPLQSGMVEDFIDRKHAFAKVFYFHPLLEPVLRPTYGVILYQEQVMQIAQILAGFTLGNADLLRRAMGKKKPEEMAKQRAIFLEGALLKNINKHVANNIFDLMEKFADYGFNKSHSVAYAMLAYQTAWLKTHYPAEFMAAVLSADMDNTDKIVNLILECKNLGLKIIPPNINYSDYHFSVKSEKTIQFGLGAIKGVGQTAALNIITERNTQGYFKNFFDLCSRVDRRKINRKVLEALIKSGALDQIGPHRAILFNSIDKALQIAEQNTQNQERRQLTLFDTAELIASITPDANSHLYVPTDPWPKDERLRGEKNTLGFYLSGHPLEHYLPELKNFVKTTVAKIAEINNQTVVIAGLLTSLRSLLSKNNRHLAIITLEDITGSIEVVIYSDLYAETRNMLVKDQLIIIEGKVTDDNFSGNKKLEANAILDLEKARTKYASSLVLKLSPEKISANFTNSLLQLLKPYVGGTCPIHLDYKNTDVNAKLELGNEWRVHLKDALLTELAELIGEDNISILYK